MWNVIVSVRYHCQFPFIPVGIINITKGPMNISLIKRESAIGVRVPFSFDVLNLESK